MKYNLTLTFRLRFPTFTNVWKHLIFFSKSGHKQSLKKNHLHVWHIYVTNGKLIGNIKLHYCYLWGPVGMIFPWPGIFQCCQKIVITMTLSSFYVNSLTKIKKKRKRKRFKVMFIRMELISSRPPINWNWKGHVLYTDSQFDGPFVVSDIMSFPTLIHSKV